MPTYEYECEKCKHRFEVFQKITDKPVSKCPKCKGKVKRLISGGIGVIFKGSGFYETDYKKKSGTPADRALNKEDKSENKKKDKDTTEKKTEKKEVKDTKKE